MEKVISATEAVRKFSEILNSIKYRGDRFTVMRGGKPVAMIHPVEPLFKERFLTELKGMLKSIPRLGAEADRFERDLREVRENQPPMPEEGRWA